MIRLLDKICDYYSEHEPSSPVPVLLNRAKRVAKMSFLGAASRTRARRASSKPKRSEDVRGGD